MSKIVVLGGAESGVGSAVLAKVKGHDVFLSDKGEIDNKYKKVLNKYNIEYEEHQHTEEKILDATEIIKSPGIPDKTLLVAKAMMRNIPIISEIEFAGRYDKAKKICITGSNGKTTTTSLIYHMLKKAGLNVGLGGNIGNSYAFQVATKNHDIYVLELSSFQLDGMYDFKADIAILLNITPDHLDRYEYQIENYVKSKFRIVQNMCRDDCFIFCADDKLSQEHLQKIVISVTPLPFSQKEKQKLGGYISGETMYVEFLDNNYQMLIKELSLQGKHNIYNSLAAAMTGKALNITNQIIRESLMSFNGVEHRLEKVLSINGITFINDSKATNVDSCWYALESVKGPIIWIAGGTDKGNDYEPLFELVKEKVKMIICLGVDNKRIKQDFANKVELIIEVNNAEKAVQTAYQYANNGDSVLLSPACASFDLFKDYEDRGKQYKEAIKNL